jgi:hypothetical protein
MEATLYDLATMRSRRDTATHMAKIFPMLTGSAGSAHPVLELMLHATSFFVEYAVAMQVFHVRLLSSAYSPSSKPQKTAVGPQPW